jgi:F-type H+-transporting ATPase subunit a
MGVLVFFLIQINSIRSRGILGYARHFCEPVPFLLPFKILEEFTFPISLSFRLFGNILAGVIIMELFFEMLKGITEGWHLPIPILQAVIPLPLNAFFDIFEPILQAFVFTMLTMSFIAKAIAHSPGVDEDEGPEDGSANAAPSGFDEEKLFVDGADYSEVQGIGGKQAG